jgi:UDP-N-acetylmuramate dehydrogenase
MQQVKKILNVSKNIQKTIYKTFGIHIETEVNVI